MSEEAQDDSTEEVTTDAQVPRRMSARETKHPNYYGVKVYTVSELQKEPESVTDALISSEKEMDQSIPMTSGILSSYPKVAKRSETNGYLNEKLVLVEPLKDT